MIIWLASYPKSGNTWVRLFIDSLMNPNGNSIDINNIKIKQFPLRSHFDGLNIDVDNIGEFVSNCINAQDRINLDKSIKIFKTHNAFWKSGPHAFTNENNTKGVIHIVRDPRNVITSVMNHFSTEDYNEAFKIMTNNKQSIGSKIENKNTDLPTVISSWSNHYNSWKKMEKNYLQIKYENLLNNPEYEFGKIAKYLNENLNTNFEIKHINQGIINCNFENLKKQEDAQGFKESAKDKKGNIKKFFNLGPKNNWKEILDDKTKKDIEKVFRKEMMELGYL